MLLFILLGQQFYKKCFTISIHPMLLFIWNPWDWRIYSRNISIHPMLLFIWFSKSRLIIFALFQYIPCYCLSGRWAPKRRRLYNFNTSHVTVYLYSSQKFKLTDAHFNTSHVTVYQRILTQYSWILCISIHPMLLFIDAHNEIMRMFYKFQYIPCYCLSIHSVRLLADYYHFNTSHVTVYQNILPLSGFCSYISIHPMLLFINPRL